MIQGIISESGVKIVEISIGLGAAAIIIDKVLMWTLKWKKNGNGKCDPKTSCVESAKWALHDNASLDIKKANERSVEISTQILNSAQRQESILRDIRDKLS